MIKFKRVLPTLAAHKQISGHHSYAHSATSWDSRQGDTVAFDVKDGEVVLRKVAPLDLEYLRSLEATLSEWSSEHDEDAYHDL